ncbi:serine/threonine protein kinase [Streptomyces bathyalis]|uniref:Serine/threonine protein kinase n=1 Tax=Streptomyces bathyalis TaxID=2710756 RepID=A0A7T1T476_9ACTN|nr:serine/threonine-protein kinase [Streptomyces bathyalis]QPP06050.1 serine/threonine protein kinase [Streptomyces bathyalis]
MQPLEAGDPRAVGPYRLAFRLGSGGMGRVFLGESPAGRRVAVKVVREDLASSPGFRERFRREAKLAMRAGGFWAAQVVDADPDAATPWIASQYVDGPSLAERVAGHGPLDEKAVRALGGGLAEALASFHKAGLVHRDLKPSNVLLVDDGPRIIDFGISKALETLETAGSTDLTGAGTILGTPGFMSPEQALGQSAGPAADVFSLGSLLVHAATGTGPFGEGASHTLLFRVVYEEPDLSAMPYGLRELAQDCLQKAPEDRPAAADLVSRLAQPTVPDPRAVPGDDDAGPWTDVRTSDPHGDALAITGPQQGSWAGSTATTRPPAGAPRKAPVGEPAGSPPAGDSFAVEQWGPDVFWRRMRRPVGWALGIDGVLLLLGLGFDKVPVMSVYAIVITLLSAIYGLRVSLPLLRVRALHVGADGLTVRHGPHTLAVPWRDIASVQFSRKKNERALTLTAALDANANIRVPSPLRAGAGVLRCTVASPWKRDTRTRVQSLESALHTFAGNRYR